MENEAGTPDGAGATPKATVLLVDDDRVTRRYLELSLKLTKRYEVEVAEDVAGAVEILGRSVIDLIASDIDMPGVDGYHFLQRVRTVARWRSIPFIFISADVRTSTKIGSFRMGVDDYVTKPVAIPELIARIDSALRRQREAKDSFRERKYNLAGDFTAISFPDLVHLLEIGTRSGRLALVTPRKSGRLLFRGGRIVHASYGNVVGEEAFYHLCAVERGHFEFFPGETPELEEETVAGSCTQLLLEGARRLDDARRAPEPLPEPDAEPAVSSLLVDRRAAPAPCWQLARELIHSLEDGYTLGELRLLAREELREWSLEPARAPRFQVLVLTAPASGVALFASMAAPLAAEELTRALAPVPRTLALCFRASEALALDVLLVDEDEPEDWTIELAQQPGALVVAPSHGDWLSLPGEARMRLPELARALRPAAILGLGNDGLQQELAQIAADAGLDCPVPHLPTHIDAADVDLRDLLRTALRAWARSGRSAA